MAFFTSLLRFRWEVLSVVIVATLGAGLLVPRLRFETDMEAIIPMSDPAQVEHAAVEAHFGLGDPLVVGILNENPAEDGVFNPRTLRLVHEISGQIARLPGIKASRRSDVASLATLDNITGTAEGLIVAPFMATVPQTLAELAALKAAVFANPMVVNGLVSRDGTGLLIVAKMEPSDGTVASVTRRETGYRQLQTLLDGYRASGTPEQFWVTGRGPMEVTYAEEVRREFGRYALPMLVLLIAMLWLTYGTPRSVLLPLLVVGLALLWTVALMAWLHIPLDFVSTMMPVIVATTGLAASIHILGGYYHALATQPGLSSSAAVLRATTTLWEPVGLASVTTTVGFLSFMTATLLPVRYFGLATAIGFTASLVLSLTLLPIALSWCPPTPSPRVRAPRAGQEHAVAARWLTRLLTRVGALLGHAPTAVVFTTVSVVLLCALGLLRLTSNSSWIDVMHPDNPIRRADEVLRRKFHGTLPLYVVVAGSTPDHIKDPAVMEKLRRLQAEVEQDPSVGGSLSIAEYVARMHRVLHEDRAEMEHIPASRELIAQYLLLYSLSGDPTAFADLVDDAYQQANVVIFLRSDHTQDIVRVVKRVEAFVTREFGPRVGTATATSLREHMSMGVGRWLAHIEPTVVHWQTTSGSQIGVAGPAFLLVRTNELVVAGQLSSLVTSLGAVFLFTALRFGSVTAGVLHIVPLSLVLVMSFGLLGLLGVPVEVGRSMTAAMVISIGDDYTIHLVHRYRELVRAGVTATTELISQTLARTGTAICLDAGVVMAGFSVLLVSRFSPNFYLGSMVALTLGACVLVTLTVFPVLLALMRPRFLYGTAQPAPTHASISSPSLEERIP